MRTWIIRIFAAISMTLALVPRLHAEPAVHPVSQDEIAWALALESKVIRENYVPSADETERYKKIAELLATQQQVSAPPSPVNTPPQIPVGIGVNEVAWALSLEEKVKSGYQPTSEEVQAYQSLAERMSGSQQRASSSPANIQTPMPLDIDASDVDWALNLEQKVKSGYQPSTEEVKRYESIAKRLSTSQQQDQTSTRDWSNWSRPFSVPTPKVNSSLSKAELDWMQELMQRVHRSRYKPTDREMALYKQLIQRKEVSR